MSPPPLKAIKCTSYEPQLTHPLSQDFYIPASGLILLLSPAGVVSIPLSVAAFAAPAAGNKNRVKLSLPHELIKGHERDSLTLPSADST